MLWLHGIKWRLSCIFVARWRTFELEELEVSFKGSLRYEGWLIDGVEGDCDSELHFWIVGNVVKMWIRM